MTPAKHAALEQVAREWLQSRDLLCAGDSALERTLDLEDIASLVTLLAAQRKAVLEEAEEIASEHSCPSYHELCDCRGDIAAAISKRAQEPRP